MRTRYTATSVFGTCTLLLAGGCAQLQPDAGHWIESAEQVSRVDKHSSFPSVRRVYFEQLNLIEMIDPKGEAAAAYKKAWDESSGLSQDDERKWGIKYDLVLAHFRESAADPEGKRLHRNSVQDRILGVATSRCNVFKTYLRRQQTDMNFLLGSATTVAGVLGAVLPGVNASRNLAATAGIFSGLQSEYNQQYYSNLASHLIVQGIELHQSRLQAVLVKERQSLSVADYSMEAAIKDAVYYDGTCSTVTGLNMASESIKEMTNPGLARAYEIIAGVRAAHEVAHAENFTELLESGRLQKLLKQATPTSSPLIVSTASPAAPSAQDRLVAGSQAQARIGKAIATKASVVAKAYADAQAKLSEDKRNKSLSYAMVAEHFRKTVDAVLAPALPVAACVKALEKPATEVGQTAAALMLTQDNTPERLKAAAALDTAKASATLAVGRVELLVDAANKAIDATAEEWLKKVAQADFDEAKLKNLAATPPQGGLTDLCK